MKSTLMAYNTSQQNSTKITPYFLMYGKTTRLSIEGKVLIRDILLDRVITLVHKLSMFRESVKIAIKKAQEKMRQDYPVQQSIEF